VDLKRGLVFLDPEDQKIEKYSTISLNLVARRAFERMKEYIFENEIKTVYVFPSPKVQGVYMDEIKKSFMRVCDAAV